MSHGVFRHGRLSLLAVVLLVALVPLAAFGSTPATAPTAQAQESAKIYLVALEDNGVSGKLIGCGDSLVPVTVTIPSAATAAGKVKVALETLFAHHDPYWGQSGLYNALYQNTLTVQEVRIEGGAIGVILTGSTGSRGVCDDPRIEEQITETARQFMPGARVVIIDDGGPLADARGPIEFNEVPYYLAQPFSGFWQANGGIPVFGFPMSNQLFEGGHRVQYLERQRFESHPENAAPYTTLLGRLGYENAASRGLLTTAPFQYQQRHTNPNCEYFVETGHHLCFGFRTYWHSHGLEFGDSGYSYRESLMLFGYPISDEYVDPSTGLTVQYFERARFEWHPRNPAPWDILLGRLGADIIAHRPH